MRFGSIRTAATLLVGVAVTLSLTSLSAADAARQPKSYQNAATAIPAVAGDLANDFSSRTYRTSSDTVRASGVATASVTCDQCTADAVTVQVLYAHSAETLLADNIAAAWSSCNGCRGVALALQVVLVRKSAQLTANNRSLALNVACVQCHTAAAAVQIVLITNKQLSSSAISALDALRQQLHDQLVAELSPIMNRAPSRAPLPPGATNAPRTPNAAAPDVTNTVLAMQSMLATAVSATASSHDIQLHHS